MSSFKAGRTHCSALGFGRAGWAASVSLVAVAAMLGGVERAFSAPVTTESELNGLVGQSPSLPGTINVPASTPLVLDNAGTVTFSDTIALDGVNWTNPYATFTKMGAGTLTLNGATISGGEAYVEGGTVNFTGSNMVDYLAVGSGTTGIVSNKGAMTIGDGASVSFGVGLSVGYYGGTGTVTQTGGTVMVSPTCNVVARCAALHIGNQGGDGTYTISGGELIVEGASTRLTLGRNTTQNTISNGVLNIDGGVVTIRDSAYLTIGFGNEVEAAAGASSGTLNQNGGILRIGADSELHLAGRGTGTYNLNGGTLEIGGASLQGNRGGTSGSYYFNLGEGTIKVIGSALDTNVDATLLDYKVATFDTNGYGATWAGHLEGEGGLRKIGLGNLSIGTLSNAISGLEIAAGTVTVGSGLDFGDSSNATTLDVAAGSALNVTGDFSLGSEDSFIVGTDNLGKVGLIAVTGTATLGDATLEVDASAGLRLGSHAIVTADQVDGAFDFTARHFAFADVGVSYSDDAAYLDVTRNNVAFATAATTPNQAAAANGLDSVSGPSDLFDAVGGLSSADAPAAFDAISGEIHAGASSVLLNESFFLRDAVLGRLQYPSKGAATPSASLASGYAEADKRSAAPFPGSASAPVAEPNTFWTQAYGSWGHSDGDSNVAKLNRSTGGVLVGYDHTFGQDWLIGAAAGYSRTSFNLDDRASSSDSNNYHLLGYAGGKVSDVNVRLGASYTWNEVDTTRHVSLPGFFETEKADYSAGTAQVFGELGYDVAVSAATTIEPFAGLAYVHLSTDGFGETGGSAALNVDGANQSVTYGTLGLRAEHKIVVGNAGVTLQGAAAWQHAWGDVTPTSVLAFSGGDAFQVSGAPIAQDALLLKAGFDVDVTAGAKLGLFYAGQLASDAADNSVQGRLSIAF
ncbi:MAG: autotransporter domain-containing protein [Candidatus Kaistia colombiensis]|nr:MAG: autotransporter domain-containing protein [Kaistia sp.]